MLLQGQGFVSLSLSLSLAPVHKRAYSTGSGLWCHGDIRDKAHLLTKIEGILAVSSFSSPNLLGYSSHLMF